MNFKKLMIGMALIAMFLIPASAMMVSAKNDSIGVGNNGGVITVTTEKMTIKIIPNQAHINWWFGNKSDADEMYKVQFVKIREFFGDDNVLDDKSELIGGTFYPLVSEDWLVDIVEGDTELTITLSLELTNGANMQLIMHVYNEDEPIPGTDQVVDGLTELKFDIVIDNWTFSPNAKGLALQSYVTELQHRHRVEIRNGTLAENGNITRTMQFQSDAYDTPTAYYEWATTADVYNSGDELIDTIDVGTAYFDDLPTPPTEAPGFAEGIAHLFLTYPNYGDSNTLVHDPSIGINEDAFTQSLPLYIIPIIGGLMAVSVVTIVIAKRK